MAARGRLGCLILLLAVSLYGLTGCHLGTAYNPSYFPYLLPPGHITPTHARPPGHGYYANFDPYALRLEVRPLTGTNPVQTQHVVVATVYGDEKPLRGRRLEWYLEGEGNIIQVDESGYLHGRGYQKDGKFAVSHTTYGTNRVTRGNNDPRDDFELRPGQSWCVISSAVEGDTYLTVVAPGIYNWDRRRMTVNVKWVDAAWEFPQPAQVRTGTQHVLTTRIFRRTVREPLANYRVRYRIIDGPPALFVPQQTQEAVVVSDLSGNAQVAIAQAGPMPGINQIEVEIIRPPDPTKPSGSGVVVAKAITTVEWLAPRVELNHVGPSTAAVGSDVPYTITISNTGRVESQPMELVNPIPEGMQFVNSTPYQPVIEGRNIVWTLSPLAPGESHTIQTVFRAIAPGAINNCAAVVTAEGQRDEKCVATIITRPDIRVDVKGPPTGVAGVPLSFDVTLTNPGSGPATNVQLKVDLSEGLEPQGLPEGQEQTRVVISDQGTLAGGEARVVPLPVVPRLEGQQIIRVTATADGGLQDMAEARVMISRPQIDVKITGPQSRFMGGRAEWNIRVVNPSNVPLNNVTLRDRLPAELIFENASDNGIFRDGEVVWDLGTLPPGHERVVQLTTRVGQTPGVVNHTVAATSDYGLRQQDTAQIEIKPLPAALRMEVQDIGDPVEIGKRVTYQIEITNTGAEPVKDVQIMAALPKELKIVNALGGEGEPALDLKEQKVSFGKITALAPNQTSRFTIEAEAVKAGDVRFETKLYADILKEPAVQTESTTIVDPNAQPAPGNPGANGNGNPLLRRPVPLVTPPPLPQGKADRE